MSNKKYRIVTEIEGNTYEELLSEAKSNIIKYIKPEVDIREQKQPINVTINFNNYDNEDEENTRDLASRIAKIMKKSIKENLL